MLARVVEVPPIDVDHPIAAVHFDDRRHERDQLVADLLDVRTLVNREAIDQLHQRGRRAGLRRMNRARDVVNRRRSRHDPVRLRVVHIDRARVRQLRQVRAVRVELREVRLGRNGDRDHLAAFFGLADRHHLDALRRRLLQHPHVLVDLFGVRELPRRARDIAENGLRGRNALRRRQIVGQRRIEECLRRVFLDLRGVLRVDRNLRIAHE